MDSRYRRESECPATTSSSVRSSRSFNRRRRGRTRIRRYGILTGAIGCGHAIVPISPEPRRGSSENTHHQAGCDRGTEFLAALQLRRADDFLPQDLLRALRMRADDQRIRNGFQAPSDCDALDLLRGVAAVAAGTDENRIGSAADPIERRVIGAIKEIFELARHAREILRCRA